MFRLADVLLDQRKLLQKQLDACSCRLQDAGSSRDRSCPQALEDLLRIQTPNPVCLSTFSTEERRTRRARVGVGIRVHRAIITGEDSENSSFS